MTNAEKKKILGAYRWHKRRIEALNDELEAQTAILRSPNLSGAPRGSNPSDLSDTVARFDAIFEKIYREIDREYEALRTITDALNRMTNEAEVTVLTLRYINGMSFDKVAEAISYSRRQTLRIHGDALQHFMEGEDGRE